MQVINAVQRRQSWQFTRKSKSMTEQQNDLQIAWWVKNIDELDREIARLCAICQVRILDRGIIERVLKKDASVCGTPNPIAFAKLHNMLMFYFANRQKSVEAVGQAQTAQIEAHVVEQLRNRFADLLGKWPPA
jgi:transcriptional regulator with AAA-type ATPase domain